MMRILIITTGMPYPPASGGAIRVHGIVEGLRQAGHNITLLAFHDGNQPEQIPDGVHIETLPTPVRTRTHRLRDLFLTDQPDIARRLYSEDFAARLRDLLAHNHYDVIQFEGIESVCYLPVAKEAETGARLCFDTFNAEYALQRNIYLIDRKQLKRWPAAAYSWIQTRRITRYERAMCQMADAVIAVSPEDQALLRDFRADRQIYVVPSGIWVDRYQQVGSMPNMDHHALVFTGKMDYRPNVDAMLWFTEAILPIVREQIPDITLYIVGQKPHAMLDHINDAPGITITGWVDSVVPYLRGAALYVAPLRMGSGTRLKLLEAMATGCPTVATTKASAGLTDQARASLRIADEASTMADSIIELLRSPEHRYQMGSDAYMQVKQHYDWPQIIPQLLDVYRELGLGD